MNDEDYPERDAEHERACRECGHSLDGYRLDALYCDDVCRMRFNRKKKRRSDLTKSYLFAHPELFAEDLDALFDEPEEFNARELVEDAEDDTELDEIQAALERTWSEFERRNPGVAHPDRVQAKISQQRALKAAEERRFTRKPKTIAELGRASRGLSPQSRATTDLFLGMDTLTQT
jgi:hypothetical protein